MKQKNLIKAGFEVVGRFQNTTVRSSFNVTDNPIKLDSLIEGTQTFGKSGVISIRDGYFYNAVSNTKVVALKNGIVYDFDTVDENGEYNLYLEDGVYDIRIEGHGYQRTIKNYQHEGGIKPYRNIIVGGQIRRQSLDIIEFVQFNPITGRESIDTGTRLVSGVIVGELGNPIKDAEIVVAETDSHRIHAFVKTGEDGKYSFTIERENYDVIVRSPRHHAKKLSGHLFVPDKGFMSQIIEKSLMFRKGGEWLWISN